jgi:hypothetical protein
MIEGLIIGGGILWIITQCVVAATMETVWVCSGLSFLRPDIIYHNTKLNYFGTGVACLALNLFFLPMALCYWFYKLCTVGRR